MSMSHYESAIARGLKPVNRILSLLAAFLVVFLAVAAGSMGGVSARSRGSNLQLWTSYPISSNVSERLGEKSPRFGRTIAFIGCVARMTSSKWSYTKEGWKD